MRVRRDPPRQRGEEADEKLGGELHERDRVRAHLVSKVSIVRKYIEYSK